MKYSQEFKDETVKLVIETSRPIAEVAREISAHEGTLGNSVSKYPIGACRRRAAADDVRAGRLRALEREVRELRMESEFLGKAAAFFAQE